MIDNLIGSLQVTIIGMGIVFFVLFLLSVIVSSFKLFNKNTSSGLQILPSDDMPEDMPDDIDISLEDDFELAAVISAAIANSLNTDISNINIKSIQRHTSKWKQQTMVDLQNRL